MQDDKRFIDTNVLVYLYSETEPQMRAVAIEILTTRRNVISTQVINEFCNVCLRKLHFDVPTVAEALNEILPLCELVIVTTDTIMDALRLRQRYSYSFYDSLMLASALEFGCAVIYSEDLSNGQLIDGSLRIVNPFVA